MQIMEFDNPSKPKRSRKERNLNERLVEENRESKMMIEIWRNFPEDLLEVVLTWLPIVVLYRFRVVCRRWNSLVTSIRFRQRLGEVAPTKQPWFFVKDGGIGPGILYDPFTKKWLRSAWMPLPTLASIFPLTFAEGLVCYLNIRHTSFFVGNPFNQCWKGLPCTDSAIVKMVACGCIAIGMVNVSNKDDLTSSWRSKIVLVDNRGNYEVFTTSNDPTSESQPMITGKIPCHIRVPSYLSPSVLTIGTKLLFLGLAPHGIISYNVKNGEWGQILLPKPLNSSDLALIECNGRLLLTGVVRDGNRSTISVRVWKLDRRVMMMWMEIDRMPSSLCSEFEGKVGASYECLCNKRVIVILLKTSRMSRLYTYDVMSREWSKVPKLSLPNERRITIISGTGFFPGFTMPFCHVFREVNQVADRVAKLDLPGARRLWKDDLELAALICKDALGWGYSKSSMAT